MVHPLSRLPIQTPAPLLFDWREPAHFQYHLLLPSFHAHSHLTHFPLLSKDSAQFSSLLPHSSDPILSPFPQRHDPICLHPSSCTCRHPPHPQLSRYSPNLASTRGLRITPVPPRFPTRTGAGPALFAPRPRPLLQHREGPAPCWHSLLPPRCVPRDLTQFPHSSNPASTLDLTTQPLPKDIPWQVTAEMSRPFTMPAFPITVRSPALRRQLPPHLLWPEETMQLPLPLTEIQLLGYFERNHFVGCLSVSTCIFFLNKNDL